MASMGLSGRAPQAGRGPRVRLIRKQGRRTIQNLDDIAAALALGLPAAEVSMLEGGDLASKSLKWQVCGALPFMPYKTRGCTTTSVCISEPPGPLWHQLSGSAL